MRGRLEEEELHRQGLSDLVVDELKCERGRRRRPRRGRDHGKGDGDETGWKERSRGASSEEKNPCFLSVPICFDDGDDGGKRCMCWVVGFLCLWK